MSKEIVEALKAVNLSTEVSNTVTSRVYVTYPTDYTQLLCITVTGVSSIWVVKAVASVVYNQLAEQADRSSDSIASEIVAALFHLSLITDEADVEVVPAPYANMADVSGIIVEQLCDVYAPDGVFNPRATVYSEGEAVWSDYIGYLIVE